MQTNSPTDNGRSGAKAALRPPKQAQPPKEQERKNTTMKKFMAILLVAIMMLSTVAFAEGSPLDEAQDHSKLEINSADITSQYKDLTGNKTEGEVHTELWLQVKAGGQIDVTVPLVLVFSTNIDGGDATAPTGTYKIINHNQTNSISVDKIAVSTNSGLADNVNMMDLVQYEQTADYWKAARDTYGVKLVPEFGDTGTAGNYSPSFSHTEYDFAKIVANPDDYDKTATDNNTRRDEVLFQIAENGFVDLNPSMVTSALTFVTQDVGDQTQDVGTKAGRGVHLLNVTYTVGLKYNVLTSEQMGTITSASESTDTINGEMSPNGGHPFKHPSNNP